MENLIKGHQGDVIFIQIESLPIDVIKTVNEPIAISNNSGNTHVLTGDVQRYTLKDRVFFKVNKPSTLQHTDISKMNDKTYSSPNLLGSKDHNPHTIPKGIYEFFIQKTYNPYTKLMEKVID